MSNNGHEHPAANAAGPQLYWAALMERSVQDQAVLSLLRLAAYTGRFDHIHQMQMPYTRTDSARNNLVATFLEISKHPSDGLIMMDCDHTLPHDLVLKLARHDPEQYGVVGAQAHRRGQPFDMCAFMRVGDQLHTIAEWEPGALIECAVVGTGAMLIRRWVFECLMAADIRPPFFRYAYQDNVLQQPTEDIHFGLACEHVGISHYVDTSVQIPHLIVSVVDQDSWFAWRQDHPESTVEVEDDLGKGAVVVRKRTPDSYITEALTDKRVSVIFPTTGRKDMALQALRSLLDTVKPYNVEIVAVIDADPESLTAITALLEAEGARYIVDYNDTYRGGVGAFNAGLRAATGEYIVVAADDLTFMTGWLHEAMKVMVEAHRGDGLVGFNDLHHDGQTGISTHFLLSRDFIIDYLGGRVAWECYPTQYSDMEINIRARRAEKYAWAVRAVVRHDHWMFGTRPKDSTDERLTPQMEASQKAYQARLAAGFPDDYPPIITRPEKVLP